jgi:hypothetical protein
VPNHVTNILTLDGPLPAVKAIFQAIAPGSTAQELETPASNEPAKPGDPIFKPATAANLAKRREGRYEIDFQKIVPMPGHIYQGDLGEEERKKYGKNNWYDWSYTNWGTKWNAYDMDKIDDYSMQFSTAWSMPDPVIKALSRLFPEIVVKIKWADEDIGCNCGEIHYRRGKPILTSIPDDQSKEAYELSFELHPDAAEYYKYDENKGTYIYNEETE